MEEPNTISQTTQTTQKASRSGKTPGSSPVLKSRKGSAVDGELAALNLSEPASTAPALLPEPMLRENKDRFVLFPIQHTDLWKKYKDHCAVIWFAEEVDLSKDMKDWEKLTADERHFIKHIIGFFAGSDGIVMENLATRFTREVQWPEAKFFYAVQNQMEAIHSETYSLLIDTYITDPKEKHELLHAIDTIPCVKKKAEWALQWIDSKEADFSTRLLAFAAVEGIFFSGAFCAIFWLRERGILPGLTMSNDFISRDEGMHVELGVLIYELLKNKPSDETIHKILSDAVELITEFITISCSCKLIGMNSAMMIDYIKYVTNRLARQLDAKDLYPNSVQPFTFMDRILLTSKSNFFEKKPTEYNKLKDVECENPYEDI
jgi:ribonucleoside-diphosphate reductase beta chain